MPRTIILFPAEINVCVNNVASGIFCAMKRQNIYSKLFKSLVRTYCYEDTVLNQSATIMHNNLNPQAITQLKMRYVRSMIASNKKDILIEKIIADYYTSSKNFEVVLLNGIIPTYEYHFTQLLNFEIAQALNAEIIFVIPHNLDTIEQLKERIQLVYNTYGGKKNSNIIGVIIYKLNAQTNEQLNIFPHSFKSMNNSSKSQIEKIDFLKLKKVSPLPLLGAVPWNFDLLAARAIDVAFHLNATVINKGDIYNRRINSIIFCTNNILNILEHFRIGSLLVASADHLDALMTTCLAEMNRIKISALLLTGGNKLDSNIKKLCECAFTTGLPVIMVKTNTWQTLFNLQNFSLEILADDHEYEHIKNIQEYVADYIDITWIKSLTKTTKHSYRLSPSVFRYQLTELARRAGKRIILPEGNEPRTLRAASICAERGIVTCILLGNPDDINCIADLEGINLGAGIEIINPEVVRDSYVTRLVELRKNKGMTEAIAREQLKDNVVLGTLMLEQGKVDGLVSGADRATADTIRPALQLIKTAPGNSLVSSIFFMLLPNQVYIYGDCAINPNPTAEQLAEIAIQSATSAVTFGIEPRVAMLSYSTGASGGGADVEKVRQATCIAKKKRPDLIIDGPLQYDAAVMTDVAQSKAQNSPVAGRATVFVFPDLNAGNITYKAVQRSANLVSIGPILQGMRKPVNDLSRGALVDDIIYTIALTAIQSSR